MSDTNNLHSTSAVLRIIGAGSAPTEIATAEKPLLSPKEAETTSVFSANSLEESDTSETEATPEPAASAQPQSTHQHEAEEALRKLVRHSISSQQAERPQNG